MGQNKSRPANIDDAGGYGFSQDGTFGVVNNDNNTQMKPKFRLVFFAQFTILILILISISIIDIHGPLLFI